MVKNVDPGALVLAPEEWGWSGYFYSGYDQQYGGDHGWSYLPDRGDEWESGLHAVASGPVQATSNEYQPAPARLFYPSLLSTGGGVWK